MLCCGLIIEIGISGMTPPPPEKGWVSASACERQKAVQWQRLQEMAKRRACQDVLGLRRAEGDCELGLRST